MMRKSLAAVALLLAPLLVAADKAERPKFFVIDAIKGDNGEIAVGTMVQQQAASAPVRELGAALARDHAAARARAIDAGRTVGVGVPMGMEASSRHLLRKLSRLGGTAFDEAFLTATIKDHRKAIDKFAQQGRAGDAVTSKLAEDDLPALREHLRVALSLR